MGNVQRKETVLRWKVLGGRKRDVVGPESGGGLDLDELRKGWCVAG